VAGTHSLPTSGPGRPLRALAIGLLLSAGFIGLRLSLRPLLQDEPPLILLLAAPILAAWLAGFGAGAFATAVCAAAELLWVQEPPAIPPVEQLRLAIFVGCGLLSSWLIASRRHALDDLRVEHDQLLTAREKLAVRERRVRETLEASPCGMIVVGAQGRIELVNREAERQFGYTRQEMVGMPIEELLPQDERAAHARLREVYHHTPAHRPMGPERELHGRRKDGSIFPVQIGLNPVEGSSSGLVLASVLDISRQRAAEAARRESERVAQAAQDALLENAAMFQSLADNIAQLAWMIDRDGSSQWFNRRWYEYTGTRPGEATGSGWRSVHPDHLARVSAKFRQHLASGDPWEDTFPLRGHDGSYRWFLSRAFPLRDHAGRIVRWFGTNTDITDHLEATQALRESDRRKDEFIAMLAHELRNPLAPVRNAVEILKRTDTGDARLVRLREIMDRQVGHMARLIDDLLDVSRIARDKLTLRVARCDLAAITCQTAEDYRASLEASGQRMVLEGCDAPVWVDGDAVRLAQMLGNLLTNAARFQQGPGTVVVRIRVDPAAARVQLSVADTGIGMDEQLLERLFSPFSQAAQDMARTQGGLGLGLALTRGLAELHGGSIVAESEGPGRGSQFRITLPLASVGTAEAAGKASGATRV